MKVSILIPLVGTVLLAACGDSEEEAQMQDNSRQMAEVRGVMDDAAQGAAQKQIEAYEAAKAGSDQMQICLEAMGVAETFRVMQDTTNLAEWEQVQQRECEPVGMNSTP